MRLAFVIRLGDDTRPSEGIFEGRVEEVDTGKEARFRSTEELLRFLGQRFGASMQRRSEIRDRGRAKPGSSEDKL